MTEYTKCERCKRAWRQEDVREFDPPWIKNNIGLIDPTGECPICDGFCYPVSKDAFKAEQREFLKGLVEEERQKRVEAMDVDHMRTRCTICGECTVCNLRACRDGGKHTPAKETVN